MSVTRALSLGLIALSVGCAPMSAFAAKITDRERTRIDRSRPADVPADADLEAAGAVIGRVDIDIGDIFDPNDPRENNRLYLLANRLHITTKRSTVEAQLLFKTGDRYNGRLLEETERALRGRRYLYDARVVPMHYADGKVDVKIVTKDVWTLSPGISFGRKGGSNSTRFELEDTNFFGWGKKLAFSHGKDVDRSSNHFSWTDPNVFGSRWTADLNYVDSNDGKERALAIERPFFALDTRWRALVSGDKFDRIDSRYNRGKIADQFQHDEQRYEIGGGWSSGLIGRSTRRWLAGWRYDKNQFGPVIGSATPAAVLPPDRILSYPYVAFEYLEDDFKKTGDQNQIGRTEDLFLGGQYHIEAGYSAKSFGATRNSVMLAASARKGFDLAPSELQQLYLSSDVSSRIEGGSARNLIASAGATYYWRWATDRLFYAGLVGTTTKSLDPETELVIGGDSGLRGYPLRYESGTSRALLTLEQRVYTNWYPFRLARFGAAVFYDAGRTWGRGVVGDSNPGLLQDIGLGLRFGNTRSGLGNVLHIDFAYALDGDAGIKKFQVNIETKRSF